MKFLQRTITFLLTLSMLLTTVALPVSAGTLVIDGKTYYYEDSYMFNEDYSSIVEELRYCVETGDAELFEMLYSELMSIGECIKEEYFHDENLKEQGYVEAICEFDSASGTVIKITNDSPRIYIPTVINGTDVKYIAEGAIENKQALTSLVFPYSLEKIDGVIIKNCPKLEEVDFKYAIFYCYPLENCPSYDPMDINLEGIADYYPNYDLSYDAGKGLAVDSKVIVGDENNRYNWDNSLTRGEATVIILRLMGLEGQAKNYASNPSPFTDVPSWANGYVNLAVEKGIVKGIGNNLFGTDNPCNAQDFLTMLYRLTHLKENSDFSWQTIYNDFTESLLEVEHKSYSLIDGKYVSLDFFPDNQVYYPDIAAMFSQCFYLNNKFTRLDSVYAIYYMMNIVAGPNDVSLADILACDYQLSDTVLYNYRTRRTGYKLSGNILGTDYSLYHSYYDKEEHLNYLRNNETQSGVTTTPDPDIAALADKITAGKTSEYEKARAISKWVSEHIFYDYDDYEGRVISSQNYNTVLKDRKGVCAGYTNLTLALLSSAGIECYYQHSLNHAWVAAVLDGKLVLIDITWDSPLTYQNGKYYNARTEVSNILEPNCTWRNKYFDADSASFYFNPSHIPEKQMTKVR